MKGSDKWGQQSGPRIEVVLAILVVITVAGVAFYYVETSGLTTGAQVGEIVTISTTGILCNSDSLPQAARVAQQDPRYANLTNGLCYNYVSASSQKAGGNQSLYFAYYDVTIAYPCGTSPLQVPADVIEVVVVVTASPQMVVSARHANSSGLGLARQDSCGPPSPVNVASVADVGSTIPAVPQLNVTLSIPPGGGSVAKLEAVLTLHGGSQIFRFAGVTSNSPLTAGVAVSSTEIILSNLSFNANEIYPMTISGTYSNGQAFSEQARIQIAAVP
jgi:hypothetical protein